jgi:hypothetical protein
MQADRPEGRPLATRRLARRHCGQRRRIGACPAMCGWASRRRGARTQRWGSTQQPALSAIVEARQRAARPAATHTGGRAPPRPPRAAHRPSAGHIRAALNLRVAALRAARRPSAAARPPDRSGRPILFRGWAAHFFDRAGPPDFGRRAARFGGWAALLAAGRPAHQIVPIPPLTAPVFLVASATTRLHYRTVPPRPGRRPRSYVQPTRHEP